MARRSVLDFQGAREVGVGVGVIRLQADGCLEQGDGLGDLAFIGEGEAEVVVGVGVESYCLAPGAHPQEHARCR